MKKLIGGIIISLMIGTLVPAFSYAQSTEDIRASLEVQIAQLLKLVLQLQVQLTELLAEQAKQAEQIQSIQEAAEPTEHIGTSEQDICEQFGNVWKDSACFAKGSIQPPASQQPNQEINSVPQEQCPPGYYWLRQLKQCNRHGPGLIVPSPAEA